LNRESGFDWFFFRAIIWHQRSTLLLFRMTQILPLFNATVDPPLAPLKGGVVSCVLWVDFFFFRALNWHERATLMRFRNTHVIALLSATVDSPAKHTE